MMSKLPDLEGLAVFAKVVEFRSFSGAAAELGMSKATVSKIISRVEGRLGARLFNRTSRRLALTDAGRLLSERAARILADGEAAEDEALAQSAAPRGLVRLAVPMSFGLTRVAPLLPDFLAAFPEVSVDLHLSDATVDLIGEGFDAALRITTAMQDSSLIARRLCGVPLVTVAAPAYLRRFGRPQHPSDLARHVCFGYAYLATPDQWRFENAAGDVVSVKPHGVLRANNGDALMPALLAGAGLAVLPDFIVGAAVAEGRLESVMTGWTRTAGGLFLVTPPGGPRPARVEALVSFLAARLAR
jgi:DNA-binding transcriptional LysR family regulator